VGSFLKQLQRVLHCLVAVKIEAAVGKGVGSDVNNPHHQSPFTELQDGGAHIPLKNWPHTLLILNEDRRQIRCLEARTVLPPYPKASWPESARIESLGVLGMLESSRAPFASCRRAASVPAGRIRPRS